MPSIKVVRADISVLRLLGNDSNIFQEIKPTGGSAVGENAVFVIFICDDGNILLLQLHEFFFFRGFNVPFAVFAGYYQ